MPLSVTPLAAPAFHVQMVRNGGLPGVFRLLNSVGVIAAPTLVACRAHLSWIKSYRDDNPAQNLVTFLAAVQQHFLPLGFWQGFSDGVGFHPPNGGFDEFHEHEGVPPFVPPVVPPVTPVVTGTSRISHFKVNPREVMQKEEAEQLFQSHAVSSCFRYHQEPNAVLSQNADGFHRSMEPVANGLLKTGNLIAMYQPAGAFEDFDATYMEVTRGLLVYKMTENINTYVYEFLGMLGHQPASWDGFSLW